MRKLSLRVAALAALIIGALFFSQSARADSLSCAAANGVTRCTGSDGLDCQTVNGHMVCAPGSKGSCETVGETTICRNGSVTQTLRTGPRNPTKPEDGDQKQPRRQSGSRLEDSSREWLSIQPDPYGLRSAMERLDRELHGRGLNED